MKNEISEYKLLGYYLLKIFEHTNIDGLSYESVKSLTEGVFKRLGNASNYTLLSIEGKRQIIDSMIKKNVFKTSSINGKATFSQVYNYEATKFIFAVYSCDKSLVFKLPKNIASGENSSLLDAMKSMYTSGMNLELQSALNSELKVFIQKALSKNRGYA